MLIIDIPGYKQLRIKNVVLDYNGTMAVDGCLIEGVEERIKQLSESVSVSVITADTFGRVMEHISELPVKINVLQKTNQAEQKSDFVRKLNPKFTVAIGNGLNDSIMLQEAELGIAIIQAEGASVETIKNADIVVNHITDALDLLLKHNRLIATLRK